MLPPEIQRRIDRLASRSRRLLILHGTGVVALLLAGMILVTFVVDYLLRLPPGMRALSLSGLVIVIGLTAARFLWGPLRSRPTADELALRIEASHPELRDCLISAVQFSREIESEEFFQSRDLARSVVTQGERRVRDLNLARAVPGSRTYRIFGSAIGAVVILGFLAAWSPYHASTWFRRICLLQGVEWKKSVVLVVDLEAREATVSRGDDFTVRVRVEKGDPDEVLIHSRAEDRTRWEDRPMVRHRREGTVGELYVHTFREVPGDFRFYVTGGDARTETYLVRVMVPPSIQEIALTVSYPAYLERPEERIPDGNLRAPYGSRVLYRAEASRPLSEAALHLGDAAGAPLQPTEGPRGDRTVLEGWFTVERSLWYRFHLADDDGYANARPIRFRLEAVPDRPPTVKVVAPGRNIAVSPVAVIPLEAEVTDDHGIRSVRLIYEILSGYAGEVEEERIPLPGPEGPAKSLKTSYRFDVSTQSVRLGDQVRYLFEAEDHLELGGPNRGRSPSYTLLIVSPEEIEADLDARLQKVRDQVRRTIRAQRATQEATLTLSRLDVAWDDARRPPLVQAELDQKKITQAVRRSIRQLGGIASDMRWNRVGDEREQEWIGSLVEMLQEGAVSRSERATETLARSRRDEDTSLLQPVPGVQEEVVSVLERVWRSLDKWTDFRDMIRRIRELKDEEERIGEAIQKLGTGGRRRR